MKNTYMNRVTFIPGRSNTFPSPRNMLRYLTHTAPLNSFCLRIAQIRKKNTIMYAAKDSRDRHYTLRKPSLRPNMMLGHMRCDGNGFLMGNGFMHDRLEWRSYPKKYRGMFDNGNYPLEMMVKTSPGIDAAVIHFPAPPTRNEHESRVASKQCPTSAMKRTSDA